MKIYFKSILSALVVSAVLMLSLLSCGNEKDLDNPTSSDLIGTWGCEFYEDEWGGKCEVLYTFSEGGELTTMLTINGESSSIPMLWRVDGNILYTLEKEFEWLYEDTGAEWDGFTFKINGNTLTLIEGDMEIASLTRKK